MMKLVACLLTVSLLLGQVVGKFTGTINGAPIQDKVLNIDRSAATARFFVKQHREPTSDADQQQVDAYWQEMKCNRYQLAVQIAARKAAMNQLGVQVTQADLQAAKQAFPMLMPTDSQGPARGQALLNGISAVLDQHQDPHQVYTQTIQPLQFPEKEWDVYLRQAKIDRPKLEQNLRGQMRITPEFIKQQSANMENWRSVAERLKTDETLDQVLAAKDPTFAADLKIYGAHHPGLNYGNPTTRDDPRAVYLFQKRRDYWNAQVSSLDIYLSDPTALKSCSVSNLGSHLATE